MKNSLIFAYLCTAICLSSCEHGVGNSVYYPEGHLYILKFSDPQYNDLVMAYRLCDFHQADSNQYSISYIHTYDKGSHTPYTYRGSLPPYILLHNNYVLFNWCSSLAGCPHYNINTQKYEGDFEEYYFLPVSWNEVDTSNAILICNQPVQPVPVYDVLETGIRMSYWNACQMLDIPVREIKGKHHDEYIVIPEDESTYRWMYCGNDSYTHTYDRWYQEYVAALNLLIDQGDDVFLQTLSAHHGFIESRVVNY